MSAPAQGMIVASRYRLVEMIGEGGMARIWRCHDETLDRPVAVKFLFLREDRDQTTLVRRFLGEARIAAAVRHPNVVDILDFGTTDDGRPFMVMELLEGESLEERIAWEPPLTLKQLVHIVSRTLDGLAAVHKAGIVHRDLKPDNVFLLDDDGETRPKLLDFGVSRDTDPSSGRRSALTTVDGYLVGTPEYMSPEQARGLKDIDLRTDIYSVGVILYEALVGALPYDAEAVGDLIIKIAAGGADPVHVVRPEAGEPISNVIAKALSVDPADRYQSAKAMKAALVAAAEASLEADVRPSLPMIVPSRLLVHASGHRKVSSSAGTQDEIEMPWGADAVPGFPSADPNQDPDEIEMPWGADAVPSFPSADPNQDPDEIEMPWGADAVPSFPSADPNQDPDEIEISAGSSEPPDRDWVVDTALPPDAAMPRWRRPWLAGLALALAVASGAAWLATRGDPDPGTTTATTSPSTPEPPPEPEDPEPVATEEPTVETPEPVTVTLRGLPSRSEVSVDGVPVEPNELGMLSIPRDDADHEIRVEAPRREAWTIVHHADAHAVYEVRLRPRRGARGRRSDPTPDEGTPTGGVFRDLDY